MPRVLNKHRDKWTSEDVYIGRPSKWGNPWAIGKHGTRAEVIAKYIATFEANPALKEHAKKELRGKNLVCFCSPLPCHGDYLLKIANE